MRSLLRPAAASRRAVIATVALVFSLAIVARAMAQNHAPVFPDLIQLPADVGAEGIAAGNGHTFYVGSLAPDTLGQILVGDLRTGTVFELVPPIGRPAGGLKFDSRSQYLFVAGGDSASVYNTRSGAEVVSYQFVPPGVAGIINDVVVTRDAAYFTESLRPFLGRVTLNHQGEPLDAELIPLPANFGVPGGCTVGAPIQSNGIAATADGRELILAHMSEGRLYLVDTATFDPIPIDITGGDFAGGAAVCSTDGLLLEGTTLYAVQAALNRVAVMRLANDHRSAVITHYLTEPFSSNPDLQIPTTIAKFGNSLYAVTFFGHVVVRARK